MLEIRFVFERVWHWSGILSCNEQKALGGMSQNDDKSLPEQAGRAAEPPPDGIAPSGRSTLRIERKGLFENAKKTLDFIDASEKDRSVKIRIDDKRSTILVIAGVSILALVSILLIVNPALQGICTILAVVADLFFGIALVWYLALRFGVLRALDPRYAVVCFQLMLGTGIFFTYLALNAALIFMTLVAKSTPPGAG